MYIESVPNRDSPPAILVRESFRGEDGKVKKRTLANISKWDPEIIEGMRLLFKGGRVSTDAPLEESFSIERTLPHGNVVAVLGMFRQLGMPALLDRRKSAERDLASALIAGRLLHPGSKLALSRHLDHRTATSTLGQELGLKEVSEQELYRAMKWLLDRKERIEARLAKLHLGESLPTLYDLTSTYYEGSTCVLAQYGYNRDGKKGKRQINFGLLCASDGCPVAVEVFPGSTSDPATVQVQIDKLRSRFGLKRVLIVGDRGMLTSARIEALKDVEDVGWISALQSSQVRKLANSGSFQMELFDQRDLAEIKSDDFPGERLIVCLNPALRQERTRKRNELLAVTEEKLAVISAACSREQNPYKGKDKIARRVEREASKQKMLKHFELTIEEDSLRYRRKEDSIREEAALDGIYVVRASEAETTSLSSDQVVETYKSLSTVERGFRSQKGDTIQVRPVFHREEEMVQAHIFTCMLGYYLQWHLKNALKASLFEDEDPKGAPRKSPVAKARRSAQADRKAASKKTTDNLPAHSLGTLLEDLGTLCRISIRPAIKGAECIYKLTEPTPVQQKVFDQLKLKPQALPCSQ